MLIFEFPFYVKQLFYATKKEEIKILKTSTNFLLLQLFVVLLIFPISDVILKQHDLCHEVIINRDVLQI